MTWPLTLLAVHVGALVALAVLSLNTPDSLQRLAMGLVLVAMTMMTASHAAAVLGIDVHWTIKRMAHEIEHIGVLVMVFRLFVVDQERRCLNSYKTSRSSQR